MPLMGFREYARHREAAGLVGGTLAAVQSAIKSGRIRDAVVHVTGEPKKIDSERANALWAERTDAALSHRHQRGGGGHATARVKAREPAAADVPAADPPATARERQANADREALDESQEEGADLESASYATARAERERANARKARMEADVMAGRLVDSEAVANAWEKIIQTSRTKVLALPSKIRTRLPHLTAAHVALIESIVRDTLDELATGESHGGGGVGAAGGMGAI